MSSSGSGAVEGPVYVWLPLVAPRTALGWRGRRAGSVVLEEGDGVPELQARLHPPTSSHT